MGIGQATTSLSERLRDGLRSLARDGVIGLFGVAVVILVWRVLREGQALLTGLLPLSVDWLPDSRLRTLVGTALLIVLVAVSGRLLDRILGHRLAAIPVIGRFARSGQRLVTELDPSETRGIPVVLIETRPRFKKIAILTAVMTDVSTGRKIAAVFVPKTPNINVGETLLVPLEQVTMTTWTVNDAIAFLVSGGSVAPSGINYDEGPDR